MMRYLIILSIIWIASSCNINIETGGGPKVKFCESVEDGACEGEAETFEPGAITVYLESPGGFGTDHIDWEIFDITNGSVSLDEQGLDVNESDSYIHVSYNLLPGKYRAVFLDADGTQIASGKVTVRGDRPTNSEIKFGTDVSEDGKLIDIRNTFKPGPVYFAIKSRNNFNTSKLEVTIYHVDGASERIVDRHALDVSPSWDYYTYFITLSRPGDYRLEISRDGKILGEGRVTIQE